MARYLSLFTVFLALMAAAESRADFGEIDILVRESIESHFRDNGLSVELDKLEYTKRPEFSGNRLTISSVVWGEQKQVAPYWGWYECTTFLEIQGRGLYRDLGSECAFQFD